MAPRLPRARSPSESVSTWWRSPGFWVLVALTLLTVGVALWQWRENAGAVAAQSRPAPAAVVRPAPDFRLAAPDGSVMQLSDLAGKVVLLNFWATWCQPCRAEMPDLQALHRDYGQRHDFTVVGVNFQEDAATVESFARSFRIAFPLLLDRDGQVAGDRYHVRTLPTSFIIDRDGNIRDVWTGQLAKAAVLARLQRVW